MHKCQKGTWVIYRVQCAGVNRGVEWQEKQEEEVRWRKRRINRVPSFFTGSGGDMVQYGECVPTAQINLSKKCLSTAV